VNQIQYKERNSSLFCGKIKCVGSEQITFPPLFLKKQFKRSAEECITKKKKGMEILPTHIFNDGVFIDNHEI